MVHGAGHGVEPGLPAVGSTGVHHVDIGDNKAPGGPTSLAPGTAPSFHGFEDPPGLHEKVCANLQRGRAWFSDSHTNHNDNRDLKKFERQQLQIVFSSFLFYLII